LPSGGIRKLYFDAASGVSQDLPVLFIASDPTGRQQDCLAFDRFQFDHLKIQDFRLSE
jgi:hypothetical protein